MSTEDPTTQTEDPAAVDRANAGGTAFVDIEGKVPLQRSGFLRCLAALGIQAQGDGHI